MPKLQRLMDDEYLVEEIIGKRRKKDRVEYLVKWDGYPEEQSTWETIENLKNVMELIEEYEKNSIDTKKLKRVSPPAKKHLIKEKEIPKQSFSAFATENIANKIKAKEKTPQKASILEDFEPSLQISYEVEEDVPEFGDFRFGDHAKRVVSCKPEGENIMMTIEWYPRPNGTIPQNTVMPSSTIRKRDPAFLIEFYESKLQFSSKSKAKNSKPLIIQREALGNPGKKVFVLNVNESNGNKPILEISSSSKKQECQNPKKFKFTSLVDDSYSSKQNLHIGTID